MPKHSMGVFADPKLPSLEIKDQPQTERLGYMDLMGVLK